MAEEYPVSVPEISKQEVSVMVEAENSELMGNLFMARRVIRVTDMSAVLKSL